MLSDCLKIRTDYKLCDWAYLQMLSSFSEKFLQSYNEATLLTAYLFCQSGYKMRLGVTDKELCLLYGTKHQIYGLPCFDIDGYYYYQLNGDDPVGQQQEGEEMFYRVSSKGIKLRDNSAYLKLLKEDVHPSGSTGSTPAKFTFRFVNWDDPVPTAIEEVNVMEMLDGANSVWYNLNGQKLNGMPASKGLYIVNGKKVLVK